MIVYGRNPVREALRGRRGATRRRDLATDGAAREPWLAGARGARSARAEEIERALRLDASTRASAPSVGGLSRTSRPASCSRARAPLIVALDQVQDPQNLGAICRTAECVGATRRRDLRAARRRGHAGGLQGLGRGRRAPARSRACATSPTSCSPPRARAAGATARARPTRGRAIALRPQPDYRRRRRARLRRRGPRAAPARRRELRRSSIALPLRGRIGSLERQRRRGARCCTRSCRHAPQPLTALHNCG